MKRRPVILQNCLSSPVGNGLRVPTIWTTLSRLKLNIMAFLESGLTPFFIEVKPRENFSYFIFNYIRSFYVLLSLLVLRITWKIY